MIEMNGKKKPSMTIQNPPTKDKSIQLDVVSVLVSNGLRRPIKLIRFSPYWHKEFY